MPNPPAFVHRQRVRYLEVDQQGVVFNSWYLAYLDEAMTAWLEHGGPRYTELMASGHDVQLVHTEIDWTGSLGWGDVAEIEVTPTRRGRTSFTLRFVIGARHEDGSVDAVAVASTVYVAITTDGAGSCPIPPALEAMLPAADAG